jgi:hypothetical protein
VTDASGAAVPGATISLFIPGGSSPVLTATTSQEGNFFFPGVQPVTYDVTVEAAGFRKEILRGVKVDTGVELTLKPFKLQVAAQSEVIEVSATLANVQTSNAELAATISSEQVRRLPTLNRSPLALIATQAGVGSNSRTNTTINGLRPSFANVTIDGINIQDNFIRTNTLDFQPNMLQLDQVGEFTISTSNTNAALGNGAAQVTFSTPSGSNELHGSLLWNNRNNKFAANPWFSNKNGVKQPFLNQNQFGGSLAGPVIKDKVFFYANYEATRRRQQTSATTTILTDSARQGIFKYRAGGAVQSVNVLQAAGVTQDATMKSFLSQIPDASFINRTDVGDGLNTAGYQFNVRNNRDRDNVTGKADYVFSPKHFFTATYIWNRDITDRPDAATDFKTVPSVQNSNKIPLLSMTWRWNPKSNFTNELRGGFNLAPGVFDTNEKLPAAFYGLPLGLTNPVNTFMPQGRYTDTYSWQNNSNWFKGKHNMSFGLQGQFMDIISYSNFDVIPTYTLGISSANPKGLSSGQLPGITSSDLSNANGLLALQAGFLTSAVKAFNVTSPTSGYVSGAPNQKNLQQSNWALYFNDVYKVSQRLTLTMGVRWEYFTPVNEVQSLYLLPVMKDGNYINTMLSNSTLDFAGNSVGRPLYGKDLNNFGPNVGMAWQPFGDGKTVIRAGYSINFPNDEFIRSIDNNAGTNSGLNTTVNLTNLYTTVSAGLPEIATPTLKVPRTFADNYALSSLAAFGMPDPNLRTPYVQQWNLSVQREVAKGVLEIRYVGNHATKQFRAFDFNQVQVTGTEFLADFKRAQNNGFLAQGAIGTFDPRYNAAISGSQPLTFLPTLPNGGYLTNATIRSYIQTGQPGELGYFYQYQRVNGDYSFFQNRYALGTNVVTNYSNATYNAGQVDYRRNFSRGLQLQANYTYSKVMSDAAGDGQTRFEPLLDLTNAKVERARTPFDLTHAFKLNGVYDLPFGKGKLLDAGNGTLNQIIGGWSVSGFMTWQSGAPFSILSNRGTLNRAARSSGLNTATSNLNKGQLDEIIGFRQTGNGPYFIAASAIGPDTRGVAGDGLAPFQGQAFFNPGAGSIGALQRRMFSGPAFWNTDFSILKRVNFLEKQYVEVRADFFNLTNHPSFYIGDQAVNGTNFGRITSTASGSRIVQFGLYYRF